ncbi:MAG: O-antigen ligase family protein [Planctomycetota bacterium]
MNTKDDVRRTWLAWALLLPAAALAWPWPEPLLARDLMPQATGIGVVALLSIPAALFSAWIARAAALHGIVVFSAWLAGVGLWTLSGQLLDTFEGARAVLFACTALALFVAGAQLSARGRAIFLRGTVAISIAWLVHAHVDRDHEFAGALGNSGHLAQAALVGALAGAAAWTSASPLWRVLGTIALLLELAYAARVPVLTGIVALSVPLALAAALARGTPRVLRSGWAAVAVATIAAGLFTVMPARTSAAQPAATSVASSDNGTDTGGVEVRLRVWRASFAMLADHLWAGVGPGQFATAFPAYRDPREIALSSHGRLLPLETEVEHAHNDWLTPVLEGGVLAGLAWLVFLAWIARAALRALLANENVSYALATLGILTSALAGAPFTFDAATLSLAFPVFGVLLADARPTARPIAARARALTALALLLVCAPRARAFVQHGLALQALAAEPPPSALAADAHVRDALNACRDSVLARTLAVRAARMHGAGREELETQWHAILDLRPQRVEAWIELGFLAAIHGDRATARPRFETALRLDPENPSALQNLASLEIEDGNVDAGLAYFERLQRVRPLPPSWLEELGARLWLRDVGDAAEALFARTRPEIAGLSSDFAYATGRELEKTKPGIVADALESRANRMWAREFASRGEFDNAVRNYRADLAIVRHYREPLPSSVLLEFAAALALTQRADEARNALRDVAIDPAAITALPEWAQEPVAGLQGR